jgi:hypothetical protein
MKQSKEEGIRRHLKAEGYVIPVWCCMSTLDHADGMGGCWGITSGRVAKQGEIYCLRCSFHKNSVKP